MNNNKLKLLEDSMDPNHPNNRWAEEPVEEEQEEVKFQGLRPCKEEAENDL